MQSNWKDRAQRRRARLNRFTNSFNSSDVERSRKIAKFAKIGFVAMVGIFLVGMAAIPLLASNLPSPDKIVRREGFSTKILDRNGEVLYDIFVDERRTPVNFDELPDYLKKATIAIEDKNFYDHQGFDPTGYLRAIYNIIFKRKLQGGSTLTQQLVKKAVLTDDRTLVRKINELVITLQLEQKYSKDEILTMYFNEIPYGGTAWGVESASEIYFGKNVKDLNLVESAFLAGLPQRPSVYSPYSTTPDAYIGRTQAVLRRMREDGHIDEETEKDAVEQLPNLEFQAEGASFKAPHFVLYVKKLLEERYGENVVERGGLKVTTTLDLSLQEKAQSIVSTEIAKVENQFHITNGASMAIDPQTGEILAMVGSKNFHAQDYDGQVNVVMSNRQPGSAIKPFTYAAALKKGYTPSTLLMDVPTTFPAGVGQPDYKPVNYDGKFRGPVQMRYALGNSLNIPAVKMVAMVGVKPMLETAYDLGLTTLNPTKELLARVGLSVTLGGGEIRLLDLASGYAPFLNEGYRVDPVGILKVEDHNGKILEQVTPKKEKRVISEAHAFLIADILSDNKAREATFGLNSSLNIAGRDVAVKTGTTNDRRDNWTVGGTPQLVVGVWVGNNDNTPMTSLVSGVSGAAPIWRQILLAGLEGKPNVEFKKPDSIVEAEVDTVSGYGSHDGFPSRKEFFAKGTEPGTDPIHVKLKLCKGDGKLATPADIAANNYDEKEYFVFKEEDPTALSGGQNRWQEGILSWIASQNNPLYNPPTAYCGTTSNPLNVEFVSPRDRDSNLPGSFTIKIAASSTDPIALVELEVDGTKVRSFSGPPYEYEITLSEGVHNFRAKAIDANGKESDRKITVGVGVAWDDTDDPDPTPIVSLP